MGRRKRNDILDTSAPPIDLDVTAADPDVQPDSLLTTEAKLHPPDSVVVAFRMKGDVQEHFKQLAREKAFKEKKDVKYQQLIIEGALRTYPMQKDSDESKGSQK